MKTEESKLLGIIEDMLTWMSLSSSSGKVLSLSHFNRAEPHIDSFLRENEKGTSSLISMMDEEVTPRDLENVDFSYISHVSKFAGWQSSGTEEDLDRAERERCKEYPYSFHRVRLYRGAAALRVSRNLSLKSLVMARLDQAMVHADTAKVSSISHYAAWTAKGWSYAGGGGCPPHLAPPWHSASTVLAVKRSFQAAFARRYDWRVCLGYEGFPSLSFVTDPSGAAEVFRLRDIPEGRARRAALLNWVSAHWRKKRNDPDNLSRVKKHMRGARRFVWNGLTCEVLPSEYDLVLLQEEHQASAGM